MVSKLNVTAGSANVDGLSELTDGFHLGGRHSMSRYDREHCRSQTTYCVSASESSKIVRWEYTYPGWRTIDKEDIAVWHENCIRHQPVAWHSLRLPPGGDTGSIEYHAWTLIRRWSLRWHRWSWEIVVDRGTTAEQNFGGVVTARKVDIFTLVCLIDSELTFRGLRAAGRHRRTKDN